MDGLIAHGFSLSGGPSDTDAGAPIFTGHRGQPETELICRS